MTPAQIIEAARNNLNAVNDDLWSDSELLVKLYLAESELAKRSLCIEGTETTSTVISTAEYDEPEQSIHLWRVEYEGVKLQYVDFREKDTLYPTGLPGTGTPTYYAYYGEQVILLPTPTAVGTLKFYFYGVPVLQTSTGGTLDSPKRYHDALVQGLTFHMCTKDLGHPLTTYWASLWEKALSYAEKTRNQRKSGDRFTVVTTEEGSNSTEFGLI